MRIEEERREREVAKEQVNEESRDTRAETAGKEPLG